MIIMEYQMRVTWMLMKRDVRSGLETSHLTSLESSVLTLMVKARWEDRNREEGAENTDRTLLIPNSAIEDPRTCTSVI